MQAPKWRTEVVIALSKNSVFRVLQHLTFGVVVKHSRNSDSYMI